MKALFQNAVVLVAAISALVAQNAAAQYVIQPQFQTYPGELYMGSQLHDALGNSHGTIIVPPIQRPMEQPPAIDTGFRSQGYVVDPSTGQLIHQSDRFQRKESAYDPNRHIVDPGSMRYVDEIQTDRNGVAWRVTGRIWSSYGQPHSELTRVRYQSSGGMLNQISHHLECERPGTLNRIQDRVETRDIQFEPSVHPVSNHHQGTPRQLNSVPRQVPQRAMDFFD